MAWLPDPTDEKDQEKQWGGKVPAARTRGQGQPYGESGSFGTGQPMGGYQRGVGQPMDFGSGLASETQGPSSFVNFSRYINANRDAAKATGAGLASDAQAKAQKAQSGAQGLQSKFSQGVASGSPFGQGQATGQQGYIPQGGGYGAPAGGASKQAYSGGTNGVFGKAVSDSGDYQVPSINAAEASGSPGVAQQGMQSEGGPQKAGPDQAGWTSGGIGLDEAQRRAGQTYSGPNSLEDVEGYGGVKADTEGAARNLDSLGNNTQGLLQEKYGGQGGYTAGQSKFDAGLSNAVSGQRFAQLRGQYGGLAKRLGEANAQAKAQAGIARGYTSDIAGKYGAAVGAEQDRRDAEAKQKAEAAKPKMPDEGEMQKRYVAWVRSGKSGSPPMSYETWKSTGFKGWESM